MSRVKNGKGRSKVSVGEAASRVGVTVYHTGQGQDERARPRPAHLLRGLDSVWSGDSNPHRESGTRWRAAADVGAGQGSRSAEGRRGNRLGDSVGADALRTREGLRSAKRAQRGVMAWGDLDSGGVWPGRMRPFGRFKRGGLRAGLVHPHAIDDAHPDVGQGADRHTMGLAFGTFAPIIVQCPAFLPCRLPGKLVQGVAQRFHAGEAFVRFSVIAALERDWCGPGQRLDTAGIRGATAILAPFGKPPRGQALAGTRQRTPELVVLLRQKKGADLLLVGGDIRDDHQQLLDQREHQVLLGAHDDLLGDQLGAMQLLKDLGGSPPRVGMLARAQRRADLCKRGCLSRLGRGVRLQKHEGAALLQLGKQVQSGRVVLLEAGGQLVDQALLRLDQCILIAGERFQLGHGGTIWLQAAQLGQVQATDLGQQMRVNLIGLGSRRSAQLIGRLGGDGIDRDPSFQQERGEPAMVGFDNTRQVLRRSRNAQQKLFQLVQACVAVRKAPRSHALARFIQHLHVMMGVRPIQANVAHTRASLSAQTPGDVGSFYSGCSKQRPSNHRLAQEGCQGSAIFPYRSSRVEKPVFPRQFVSSRINLPTLGRKGLKK